MRAGRASLVVALFFVAPMAQAGLYTFNGNDLRIPPGVYYPGPFYSRQYLQDFPLQPGQVPVYYRLSPYEHYGLIRQGSPVRGLTDGGIHADRFPYRYKYGFQPTQAPVEYIDPCKDLRRMRPE